MRQIAQIVGLLKILKWGLKNITYKTAQETQISQQRVQDAKEIMPSSADIGQLGKYLENLIDLDYQKLTKKFSVLC